MNGTGSVAQILTEQKALNMPTAPLGVTPLIAVFDMVKSLAFYRDQLGFEVVSASPPVETTEGHFSHWMWLRSGAVELMLNTQYDSNERPDQNLSSRVADHGDTSFYLGFPDLDATHEQLIQRGLKVDPPKMAPYGLRAFEVTDPDGYRIIFQETR